MKTGEDLKEGNKVALTVYVVAHGLVTAWVILRLPVSLEGLSGIAKAEWAQAFGTILLAILVTLLNRAGTRRLKAILIFWRVSNPELSSRAFSTLAPRDPRIDMERLKKAVGSKWPEHPNDQAAAWYRLYKLQGDAPAISSTHREYLLCRDLTWLTAVVALPCLTMLLISSHRREAYVYLVASLGLYLLGVLASRISANALVTTVLACAAADQEILPSPIVIP